MILLNKIFTSNTLEAATDAEKALSQIVAFYENENNPIINLIHKNKKKPRM